MHGWAQVDTARCERCGVYTPTTDLVFSPSGRSFCDSCGVQKSVAPPAPTAPKARVYVPVADVGDMADMTWAPYPHMRLEHPARVAAVVMLAVTLCFWLAACASSQL